MFDEGSGLTRGKGNEKGKTAQALQSAVRVGWVVKVKGKITAFEKSRYRSVKTNRVVRPSSHPSIQSKGPKGVYFQRRACLRDFFASFSSPALPAFARFAARLLRRTAARVQSSETRSVVQRRHQERSTTPKQASRQARRGSPTQPGRALLAHRATQPSSRIRLVRSATQGVWRPTQRGGRKSTRTNVAVTYSRPGRRPRRADQLSPPATLPPRAQ